jgi:hypothetical protein
MTSRSSALTLLLALLVGGSACDGCKKKTDTPATPGDPAASGSTKPVTDLPMVLGVDAGGPIIPPPRPATSALRPSAVPSDAPGLCRTDANCPIKAGIEQLCCISTSEPGGPGLFCQDKAMPCQRSCVTDADCRVGKRCDLIKGTPSGVVLRGCM